MRAAYCPRSGSNDTRMYQKYPEAVHLNPNLPMHGCSPPLHTAAALGDHTCENDVLAPEKYAYAIERERCDRPSHTISEAPAATAALMYSGWL